MKTPSKPRLLVSIINWNNTTATERCLQGIGKIPKGTQPDVYLTDNHSLQQKLALGDQTKQNIRSLKLVFNHHNKGFAGAHNNAITYAIKNNYDYVCLLNNDTELVDEHLFDKLVAALQKNTDAIAAAPTILYKTTPPTIWFGGGTMNLANATVQHNHVGEPYNSNVTQAVQEVSFLTGCCMMICLRNTAINVQLNEDYFLYWEDADWCARMHRAGKKLLYVPNAALVHEVSGSFGIRSAKYGYYNIRNALLFAKKWSPSKTVFFRYLWQSLKIFGLSLKSPAKIPSVTKYLLLALKHGLAGKTGPIA